MIVPTEIEDEETVRRTRSEFDVCKVIRPLQAAPETSSPTFSKGFGTNLIRPTWRRITMKPASRIVRHSSELMKQHDLVWIHTDEDRQLVSNVPMA